MNCECLTHLFILATLWRRIQLLLEVTFVMLSAFCPMPLETKLNCTTNELLVFDLRGSNPESEALHTVI